MFKHIEGQRVYIPPWLSNPVLVAPCLCGEPLMPDQPWLMAEGITGMKRWFHGECYQAINGGFEMPDGFGPEEWSE